MIAFFVGSCAEITAPAKVRVPGNPHESLTITDWYSCWRFESSTTWDGCEYIGSTADYIAGWELFDNHAPQYTSLQEVKVTNSTCPECPDDPNQDRGPHLYIPTPDDADILQKTSRPDCRYITSLDAKDKAWCKAGIPQYSRKTRIADALAKMAQLGGVCADLAAMGQSVLSEGALRVYTPNADGSGFQKGGFASANMGARGYIVIHKNYTDAFWQEYDTQTTKLPDGTSVTFKVNLQFILAHEIDHLGSPDDHLDPISKGGQGWLTPHAIQCSGLGSA